MATVILKLPLPFETEIVAKSETVPWGWKAGALLARMTTPSSGTARDARQAPDASS